MLDPVEYTIGWVCALVSENVAAAEFLDEEHDPPERRAETDTNTYTLGRIGQHNVVIAVLPLGEYGTASAAGVAINMLRSYPSIKIGLMVGIGGGVPSLPDRDIRLGDVVVSCPENGHSGVFQFDFGKTVQEKEFQHTRSLDQPPQALLTALAGLRMRHTRKGSGISKAIDKILVKNPRLKREFGRPSPDTDILFESKFTHAGGPCATTCVSDSANIVQRPARQLGDDDDPEIHYGTIASGNQLMKDAVIRDLLGAKENVLCFEMEAAGLMNRFPCAAIRGICDYSDSHKSKEWQGFAAMVAAAYASDLIRSMASILVRSENPILGKIDQTLSIVQKIASEQDDNKKREILNWLTDTNFAVRQSDLLAKRQPGTCQWLLDTEEYQTWTGSRNQTLFCYGIPGAGKTFLSSIVIHDLETRFNDDSKVGIAYIYCDHNNQDRQNIEMMFASVLKQLCQRLPGVPDDVMSLYEKHRGKETKASAAKICEILQSVSAAYSRVLIVIDALDEWHMMQSSRSSMIQQMSDLQAKTEFSLFVTSRPIPDIKMLFSQHPSIEFEASQEDIAFYIQANQEKLPNFVNETENPGLLSDIQETLSQATKGMFLVAAIYLERLKEEISARDLRETLQHLQDKGYGNSRADTLRDAYNEIMERICRQNKNHKQLAWQVLSWIAFARRKLTTQELQHALVLRDGDVEIDYNGMIDPNLMVSVCCGLIMVDPADDTMRLIHYTTQDFFRNREQTWLSNAEGYLAKQCIAYLSLYSPEDDDPLRLLSSLPELMWRGYVKERLKNRFRQYPFYQYSAIYWGYHARSTSENFLDEINMTTLSFLNDEPKASAAMEGVMHHLYQFGPIGDNIRAGLYLAAHFGLDGLMDTLLQTHPVNSKDGQDQTPLGWACRAGQVSTTRILIEKMLACEDIDLNGQNSPAGETPLHLAAAAGHPLVVQLLIKHGADTDIRDWKGRTPIANAARRGHYDVVEELLIARGGEAKQVAYAERLDLLYHATGNSQHDVARFLLDKGIKLDKRTIEGDTSLIQAARMGNEMMVRLLLREGANPNFPDWRGGTALSEASQFSHETNQLWINASANLMLQESDGDTPLKTASIHTRWDTINLLLESGADPNLRGSRDDDTVLMAAAVTDQRGLVEPIIEKGAEINVQGRSGATALIRASERGYVDLVKLLLDKGADPDVQDDANCTALMIAIKRDHHDVSKLLIENGAAVHIQDQLGCTALMLAIERGNRGTTELLVEKGLAIDLQEENGYTALDLAFEAEEIGIADLLVKKGATANVYAGRIDLRRKKRAATEDLTS